MLPLTEERTAYPRERGEDARERIRLLLVERQARGEDAPTMAEIVKATGFSKTNVRHHVEWLEQEKLVKVVKAQRKVTRQVVVLAQP